jgi:hypothetical protein
VGGGGGSGSDDLGCNLYSTSEPTTMFASLKTFGWCSLNMELDL